MNGCSVSNCERVAVARSWCLMHWKRWKKHGDPELRRPDTSVSRFMQFVDTSAGLFGCWPWMGARDGSGYGAFHYRGRRATASRVALELALGRPLGDDEWALHACDNPPCVRVGPGHLYVGTVVENNREMYAKGRAMAQLAPERLVHGEASPHAKLTEADVRAIRTRRASGESPDALAQLFGISRSEIWRVVSRRKWTHVA